MTENSRPLSPGETALAASMFGTAIDYAPVRIHRRRWWPFQPRNCIMAPDGHIWVHPQGACAGIDFAAADLGVQALFIHEMTHVWQHQQGLCLPLRRHPFCRYAYRLEPGKPFERYGIEQQAEIVRDIFLARRGLRRKGAPAASDFAELPPSMPLPWAGSPRATPRDWPRSLQPPCRNTPWFRPAQPW
jgi:hypothetical protein